jgi:hypothetical protein
MDLVVFERGLRVFVGVVCHYSGFDSDKAILICYDLLYISKFDICRKSNLPHTLRDLTYLGDEGGEK